MPQFMREAKLLPAPHNRARASCGADPSCRNLRARRLPTVCTGSHLCRP